MSFQREYEPMVNLFNAEISREGGALCLRWRFADNEVFVMNTSHKTGEDGTWEVRSVDHLERTISPVVALNTKQMSALVALAVGIGEEPQGEHKGHSDAVNYLYEIVEPAISDLKREWRPIP